MGLVLISGCDFGGGVEYVAPTPEAVRATVLAQVGAGAGMPSGIVYLDRDLEVDSLVVHAVESGRELRAATIPNDTDVVRRDAFDRTMSRYVYAEDCVLHVATLTTKAYVPTAEWRPAQLGGAGHCLSEPRFQPDGRVMLAVGDKRSVRISVDPAHPETAAKDEGDVPLTLEQRYTAPGTDGVTVSTNGYEIEHVSTDEEGDCGPGIGGTAYLCHGVVVTLSTGTKTATTVKLVDVPDTDGVAVFVDREQKRLAVGDASEWFTATVADPSKRTKRPWKNVPKLGDPMFWN
ncbi:hypothetical protein [Winogradskya humida]|uniref:hypothetical protein n=1 Tax=Winogradskya humida TaxID=113566 RepID=UPI0019428F5E|nr:hypothetical protein [Actinoplanes humidus]